MLWVFCILIAACVGIGLHMVFSPNTKGTFPSVWGIFSYSQPEFILCSCPDTRHTATSFPHMRHECQVVDRMDLRGFSRHLRCVPTLSDGIATSHRHASLPDMAAFTCIFVVIIKLIATVGQRHTLLHLMKTLIRDSTIYFLIVLTLNIAMLVYAIIARATLKNYPLV